MARRLRRFRSGGRPARGMDWGGARFSNTLTGATAVTNWVLTPADARTEYVDPTIMAIRANFMSKLETSVAAGSVGAYVGFGLIAWDGEGVTPPSAPPLPVSGPYYDWMLRNVWPLPPASSAGQRFDTTADSWLVSKARRRLGNQTGLLYVVEFAPPTGGTTLGFAADVRYLLKE